MGHYFSEMREPMLTEQIEDFCSGNFDRNFTLTSANETIVISRAKLVQFLSKYRQDKQFLSQIRALFHELSK